MENPKLDISKITKEIKNNKYRILRTNFSYLLNIGWDRVFSICYKSSIGHIVINQAVFEEGVDQEYDSLLELYNLIEEVYKEQKINEQNEAKIEVIKILNGDKKNESN